MQDCQGGGGQLFGGQGEMHAAERLAARDVALRLLGGGGGGVGGMPLPHEKKIKWCNLVRFGVHFYKTFT